ncbi:hypothetical protein [Nonomuraea sp. CA-141351]
MDQVGGVPQGEGVAVGLSAAEEQVPVQNVGEELLQEGRQVL